MTLSIDNGLRIDGNRVSLRDFQRALRKRRRPSPGYVKGADAIAVLDIKPWELHKLREQDKIEHRRVGHRWYYSVADLQYLIRYSLRRAATARRQAAATSHSSTRP